MQKTKSTSPILNFIGITNDLVLATALVAAGVNQIMIDIERKGKAKRQKGRSAVMNNHKLSDLKPIRQISPKLDLLCRINPFHQKTKIEIGTAIENGANSIMLPMITSLENVKTTKAYTREKVQLIPLIETPFSLLMISEIIKITECRQIHFGLNDLGISLKNDNIFSTLLLPSFRKIVEIAAEKKVKFGIGGVGDPYSKNTINPKTIIKSYKDLGASVTILSRRFFDTGGAKHTLQKKIEKLQQYYQEKQASNVFIQLEKEINAQVNHRNKFR